MKQRLIFISGFAASGKTETGEFLHEKFVNCARVESDFLILVKPFEPGQKLSELKILNTTDVVRNFLKTGFENILIIGAIWQQSDLDKFLENFSIADYGIFVFWLDLSREERLARASKRQDMGDNAEWFAKVESTLQVPELPLKGNGIKSYKIEVQDRSQETIGEEIYQLLK